MSIPSSQASASTENSSQMQMPKLETASSNARLSHANQLSSNQFKQQQQFASHPMQQQQQQQQVHHLAQPLHQKQQTQQQHHQLQNQLTQSQQNHTSLHSLLQQQQQQQQPPKQQQSLASVPQLRLSAQNQELLAMFAPPPPPPRAAAQQYSQFNHKRTTSSLLAERAQNQQLQQQQQQQNSQSLQQQNNIKRRRTAANTNSTFPAASNVKFQTHTNSNCNQFKTPFDTENNDDVDDDAFVQSLLSPVLPDSLIAHISSFLPTRDLACIAACLNKQWHHVILYSETGLYLWRDRRIRICSPQDWHAWTQPALPEMRRLWAVQQQAEMAQQEQRSIARMNSLSSSNAAASSPQSASNSQLQQQQQSQHGNNAAANVSQVMPPSPAQTTGQSQSAATSPHSSEQPQYASVGESDAFRLCRLALARIQLCPRLYLRQDTVVQFNHRNDEWCKIMRSPFYWPHFTHLQALHLQMFVDAETVATFSSMFQQLSVLAPLRRLQAVSLEYFALPSSAWSMLAPFSESLRSLRVCGISDIGVMQLQLALPQLQVLHCASSAALSQTQGFQRLRDWTSLRQLHCGMPIWQEEEQKANQANNSQQQQMQMQHLGRPKLVLTEENKALRDRSRNARCECLLCN